MLYCCEVCGKKHTTEEKALECERLHEEEKARREELVKEKENSEKEISKLWDELMVKIAEHRKTYCAFPTVCIRGIDRGVLDHMFNWW